MIKVKEHQLSFTDMIRGFIVIIIIIIVIIISIIIIVIIKIFYKVFILQWQY